MTPFARLLPRLGGSLVGRLVLAASAWCLVLLVVAGGALTASFNHAAEARLDQSLAEDADDLYAGAAVAPNGDVYAWRPFAGSTSSPACLAHRAERSPPGDRRWRDRPRPG